VNKATSGEPVVLTDLWEAAPGCKTIVVCLTHFADLSSWELAQKLVKVSPAPAMQVVGQPQATGARSCSLLPQVLPTLEASSVRVFAIGLGSVANANQFADTLSFPKDILYACPHSELYKALGFSPGFGDGIEVSPYAKLLPMLMGIGSPGTLQEVRPLGEGTVRCRLCAALAASLRQSKLEPIRPSGHSSAHHERRCVRCVCSAGHSVRARYGHSVRQQGHERRTVAQWPPKQLAHVRSGLPSARRGYVGDSNAKPVFSSPTPFDILGQGYQRPFE
jgi:hypothetical protein